VSFISSLNGAGWLRRHAPLARARGVATIHPINSLNSVYRARTVLG